MGRRAAVVGAVDGARARAPVHALRDRRRQRPRPCSTSRSRPSSATPRRPRARSTSAASTSARTTCAAFDWDPFAYERGLRRGAGLARRALRAHADRHDPARPRPPARGREGADANAIIERRARETGALVVDLARLPRPRRADGRPRPPDRVRPDRDRRARARRARAPTACRRARAPRELISLARRTRWRPPARRRDLPLPPREGQCRGGVEPVQVAARTSVSSRVTRRRRAKTRRAPTSSAREAPRSCRVRTTASP